MYTKSYDGWIQKYSVKNQSDFLFHGVVMQGTCPIHGATKYSFKKEKGGYYCIRCNSAKVKRDKRTELKQKAIKYKGGKCSKCGYLTDSSALEFHHVDSATKEFNISKDALGKPWKEVQLELDKCILLCANCHREVHSFMK